MNFNFKRFTKAMAFAMLFIFSNSGLFAQGDPPICDGDTYFEHNIVVTTTLDPGNATELLNGLYNVNCNAFDTQFNISFPSPDPGNCIEHRVQIFSVSYADAWNAWNSNGGSYGGGGGGTTEQPMPTSLWSARQLDYDGNWVEVSNSPATISLSRSFNTDGNRMYIVVVYYKRGCSFLNKVYYTRSRAVDIASDGAATVVDADLNEISTYLTGCSGVTIHEMDQATDILLDGSGSSCYNDYLYAITEWDPCTYTAIGPAWNSGWNSGQAPAALNLSNNYPYGFDYGKIYHVTFVVGPGWTPTYLALTYKAAVLQGTNFPASQGTHIKEVTQRGGPSALFTVHEFCDDLLTVFMDGSASQYEGKYRVEVTEMTNNMTPTGTLAQYPTGGGWATGQAPSNINLTTIYAVANGSGFNTSKTYRAELFIGEPEQSIKLYFNYKTCSYVERRAEASVKLHPNPATDHLRVTLPGEGNYERIGIYDLNGRLLRSMAVNGQFEMEIGIHDLPAGMYLLRAEGAEVSTLRFVKQ